MNTPRLVSFDRVADVYDETRGHPPEVSAAIADALIAALPPGPRLLEVGIGTGRIARPLLQRNIYIAGLDLSVKMLARLLASLPPGSPLPPLAIGDGCHLPFRSGWFDVVLFVHVLHLLPDWRAAIAEARRVIRHGGRLVSGLEERQPDAPQEQIRARWHELANAHRQVGWRPDPRAGPDTLQAELLASGATYREWQGAAWQAAFTPARFIDYLEAGVYSSSFSLSPADLHACAEELRSWTVERYGPLDQEFTSPRTFIWRSYDWED